MKVSTRNAHAKCRGCGTLFLSLATLTILMARRTLLSLDQAEILPLLLTTTKDEPTQLTPMMFNDSLVLPFNPRHRRRVSSLPSSSTTTTAAEITTTTTTSIARFSPLSCLQVFYDNRDKKRPWDDPNEGSVHGRYTITQPAFWISLHLRKYDKTRWSIMDAGLYYETVASQSFVDILRAEVQAQRKQQQQHHQKLTVTSPSSLPSPPPPPLHVVDVGGNIGWYSLLSIATAVEQHYPIVVDVFEPNPRNHPRFCESLFINEWLHPNNDHQVVTLNLYPFGVTSNLIANNHTAVGRMDISKPGRGSLGAIHPEVDPSSVSSNFPLVSLDQMAKELHWMTRRDQPISILKVDVEGFELDVFEGGQEFLQSHVVQNIFFEGNLQHEGLHVNFHSMARVLVRCGYVAYKVGGFRGADAFVQAMLYDPSKATSHNNNNSNSSSLLDDYVNSLIGECKGATTNGKFKRRQCNMWWRLFSLPDSLEKGS